MRKVYFKKTVWESFEIPDNISDQEIKNVLSITRMTGNLFHKHFSDNRNIDLEYEDDYESEVYMRPSENKGHSTIEFIKDGSIEWENGETNYTL